MDRNEIVRWLILNEICDDYLLSATEPFATELEGVPALDVVEEDFKTYFYITKKGRDLHLSTSWPFNGERRPRG